jgi:hypothetical protein
VALNDEDEVPEGAAVMPVIPADLGAHPLLLAALHAIVFLSGSEPAIVQPDAATEALDHIASYLQRLRGPELQRLREDLDCLVAFGKEAQWDREAVQFLKEFIPEFGIGEAGPDLDDEAD